MQPLQGRAYPQFFAGLLRSERGLTGLVCSNLASRLPRGSHRAGPAYRSGLRKGRGWMLHH